MVEDLSEHSADAWFELVRRGYDQQQVDDHLRRLDAEIRILMADREAAVDQAAQLGRELDESRARADRLRAQVRGLVHAPQNVQGMSERIRSMLRMAQDEVADMLARTEAEIGRRHHEADRYVAELTAAAQADADAVGAAVRVEAERSAAADARARVQTEQECDAARAAVAAERAESEQQMAEATEQARRERGRAWSEAEIRRGLVEEDFSLAMDQRRAEMLAELTAGRAETQRRIAVILTTAAERSREMVAEADRTARETVAEAQRQVDELTAVRGRVAEQLRSARGELNVTLDKLAAEVDGERTEPIAAVGAPNGSAQQTPGSTTNNAAAEHSGADGIRTSSSVAVGAGQL